jgi:hypothetical protein
MATYIKAGVIAAIILLVVVMLVGRRAHADRDYRHLPPSAAWLRSG